LAIVFQTTKKSYNKIIISFSKNNSQQYQIWQPKKEKCSCCTAAFFFFPPSFFLSFFLGAKFRQKENFKILNSRKLSGFCWRFSMVRSEKKETSSKNLPNFYISVL